MKHFTLSSFLLISCLGASAQLINPGFESGLDVGWTENSTNFGSPLCDADCGNCGGPCAPQAGDWYAWFGGAGQALEVGSISQVITIANGSQGEISFWVKVPSVGDVNPATIDRVKVELDGTTIWSVTAGDSLDYQDYVQVTVDIDNYTDGGSHVFGVSGSQNGGSNILFDSFSLEVDGNISVGFDQVMNQDKPFVLYPNPANHLLNLQFGLSLDGDAEVRLIDLSGRVVSEQLVTSVQNKLFTLDTQMLPAGMYTVEVVSGTNYIRERVSITH